MTSATSCSANSQFCPEGCARAEKGTKNIHQLGTPPSLGTASGSIPPPAKHLRRGCTACSTLPGSNLPKLAIRPSLTAYLCPVWAVPAGWPGWKSAAPESSLQPGGSVCGPRACCWVGPVSRCRSRADESSPRGSCAPPSGSALQRQHDGG